MRKSLILLENPAISSFPFLQRTRGGNSISPLAYQAFCAFCVCNCVHRFG
nr:MAG TPA: hypothetical protein [Caudoviricetes sp.]